MTDRNRMPGGTEGPDVSTPNIARMYDYYLGGKDNFAADRQAAERLQDIFPALDAARDNRAFVGRAVRFLAAAGIDQFIDLGAGLPTQGNVHEIARELLPQARVLYVDSDSVVAAHGRALLETAGEHGVRFVQADLREPDAVLARGAEDFIDFDRPVAVLATSVLHFVPEADHPAEIITRYRDAVVSGSHLAISHASTSGVSRDLVEPGLEVYRRSSAALTPRTREGLLALFAGFELVPPGLVAVPEWRPDDSTPVTDPIRLAVLAGVGRKP